MRVACGFDHAGVSLRERLLEALAAAGVEALDVGTADDYPDVAVSVARAVLAGEAQRGVVVCGSGAGVAVAASKIPGIRATVAHDTYTAAQCVSHDDVNVLCLGSRVVGPEVAAELVGAFAAAEFSGAERHRRRIGKVLALERDGLDADLNAAEPFAR